MYGGQQGGPGGGGRARDSYADYGQSPMVAPSRNRFSQRVHSDTALHRYSNVPNGYAPPLPQPVYPNQGYQQSRDTVSTGPSSGSEPWGNSTDPSSENSSVERMHATQKPMPDPGEQQYGGYGAPIHEDGEYAYPPPTRSRPPMNHNGSSYFQRANHDGTPPPVPPHAVRPQVPPQVPIKLGAPAPNGSAPMPLSQTSGNTRPTMSQSDSKRKSWFKRRFSKD